jgi:hypothetical protein
MTLRRLSTKITSLTGRNIFDILIFLILAAVVIKLISLNTSVTVDDDTWNEFKTAHNCQLQKSAYGNQEASWLCNDGKVYYRWRQQR